MDVPSQWIAGLTGGLLIGTASALLLLTSGRIAGISGILAALPGAAKGDVLWRLAFLCGLIIGPLLSGVVLPDRSMPLWLLLPGGFLVGYGTRLGSGCTSGHGVCGLARLSGRSLVAVITFMVTAMVVTFILRHVVGLP